jgi:signal transduction protein with GAF and PtsI domain
LWLDAFATAAGFGENRGMSEPENAGLAEKLRRLVETIDIASALTEPLTRSIEHLLRVSAADLNAAEASVLIRDGDEGDLRFLCATGEVAEKLLNLKVPAGKGIAGFVMSSGQPMAVADVGSTESFYAEVDKTTGFSTEMILATPLRHDGEIIGVLEFVNRSVDHPHQPFTPDEMDRAAGIAEVVASLVNAYEAAKIFRDYGDKVFRDTENSDASSVQQWLGSIRSSPEHTEMIEMAVLIREIAGRGDAERRICREVLESVMRYSDSKEGKSFLSF